MGSAAAETVAELLRPLFAGGQREALPAQTPFHTCEGIHSSEEMDVTQAKLCLGFVTPITNKSP